MLLRSARHPAPVIELGLFRARSFAVANAGMFAFATAFYALLLCNILFLTGIWGCSILEAGFAVTPGPLMAAASAPVGGRLADRFGQRVVAAPGALFFTTGCVLFATGVGAEPAYASEYLIPTMLTGIGVGLSFAAWGSAAVAELPGTRFASRSAVLSAWARSVRCWASPGLSRCSRRRRSPIRCPARRAWTIVAVSGAVVAGLALALGRVRVGWRHEGAREPARVGAGSCPGRRSPSCSAWSPWRPRRDA